MSHSKYNALDEAWAFVVSELGKGRSKKDIVPLMNESGFSTLKGRPWTYQTLLLEQRRRANEVARQSVEAGTGRASAISENKKKTVYSSIGAEKKFNLPRWADDQSAKGLGLEEMCQELRRMEIQPPFGVEWSPSLLSYELGNRLLNEGGSGTEGKILDDGRSIVEMVENSAPVEDDDSHHGIDEVWSVIEEEARKGTKKQDMVHVLNLQGLLTRRGKPWTYPVLSQEIRRRKDMGQELPTRRLVLATVQQKEVSTRINESISRARDMIEKQILPELKSRNLKTRKGRDWTYPVLLLEMLKRDIDPEAL